VPAAIASRRDDARLPYAAVGVTVLVWGVGPLFMRAVHLPGVAAGFWRMWLSVPLSVLLARALGTPLTFAIARRAALGGVLFASSFVASYEALHRTSVATASLISALQPVLVIIAARPLFGERVGGRDLLWSALAFIGIAAVVAGGHGGGGHGALVGDLYGLVNLVLWAGYFLELKRRRTAGVAAFAHLAGIFVTGAIVITPYALLTGAPIGAIDRAAFARILLVVLGPGLVGHGLMTWAQRHIDVTVASLLTLGSVPIATVGAWIVFHQSLDLIQMLGGVVVLGALAALVVGRSRAEPVGQAAT
jgi:drug/metabolite transporter (DMT)-like permease